MIGPALLELLINGREPEPQGNFSATAQRPMAATAAKATIAGARLR